MITANSCRCIRCKKLMSYEERIKITAFEFFGDTQCSGSRSRTIDGFNLCKDCYTVYQDYISKLRVYT
jgi:hypothetical protein